MKTIHYVLLALFHLLVFASWSKAEEPRYVVTNKTPTYSVTNKAAREAVKSERFTSTDGGMYEKGADGVYRLISSVGTAWAPTMERPQRPFGWGAGMSDAGPTPTFVPTVERSNLGLNRAVPTYRVTPIVAPNAARGGIINNCPT